MEKGGSVENVLADSANSLSRRPASGGTFFVRGISGLFEQCGQHILLFESFHAGRDNGCRHIANGPGAGPVKPLGVGKKSCSAGRGTQCYGFTSCSRFFHAGLFLRIGQSLLQHEHDGCPGSASRGDELHHNSVRTLKWEVLWRIGNASHEQPDCIPVFGGDDRGLGNLWRSFYRSDARKSRDPSRHNCFYSGNVCSFNPIAHALAGG